MALSRRTSEKMSTIELELSEEERAQLLTSLVVGLSDSSLSNEAVSKTVSTKKHKKSFIGPPRPVNRDAMGRYIPKPGEKPLSMYDMPGPGPDLYYPDYNTVMKKFPEYSMGESGIVSRKKKRGTPAPNKYNTSTSFVWGKCKTFTMKQKFPSTLPSSLGPGPAAYAGIAKSLGGPKHTMVGRPKTGAMHCLLSSLVRNPDPTVPGPQYSPYKDEWLDRPVTFGIKHKLKRKEKRPGPSNYTIKDEPTGPKWKIASRYRDDGKERGPGPAKYNLKPLFPEKKSVSMGIKHAIIKDKNPTPGPNEYNKDRKFFTDPGYTLQYRWYETKPEKSPGPGHYRVDKNPTLATSPAYTIKKPWRKSDLACYPGPGDYNVLAPPMDKGTTIWRRYKETSIANPSPADYYSESSDQKRRASAPAYSFTSERWRATDDTGDVGPGSYIVQDCGVIKPAKSFGIRHHVSVSTVGPGPAQEPVLDRSQLDSCRRCECDRFVTVKSRHTPIKYSGFRDINAVERQRPDIPPAPLLG